MMLYVALVPTTELSLMVPITGAYSWVRHVCLLGSFVVNLIVSSIIIGETYSLDHKGEAQDGSDDDVDVLHRDGGENSEKEKYVKQKMKDEELLV